MTDEEVKGEGKKRRRFRRGNSFPFVLVDDFSTSSLLYLSYVFILRRRLSVFSPSPGGRDKGKGVFEEKKFLWEKTTLTLTLSRQGRGEKRSPRSAFALLAMTDEGSSLWWEKRNNLQESLFLPACAPKRSLRARGFACVAILGVHKGESFSPPLLLCGNLTLLKSEIATHGILRRARDDGRGSQEEGKRKETIRGNSFPLILRDAFSSGGFIFYILSFCFPGGYRGFPPIVRKVLSSSVGFAFYFKPLFFVFFISLSFPGVIGGFPLYWGRFSPRLYLFFIFLIIVLVFQGVIGGSVSPYSLFYSLYYFLITKF